MMDTYTYYDSERSQCHRWSASDIVWTVGPQRRFDRVDHDIVYCGV